jgi:hypothetical protein
VFERCEIYWKQRGLPQKTLQVAKTFERKMPNGLVFDLNYGINAFS